MSICMFTFYEHFFLLKRTLCPAMDQGFLRDQTLDVTLGIDSHTAPPPASLLIHLLTPPPAPLFYFFVCVMCSFCLSETHTNYNAKSTEAATRPCGISQCSMFSLRFFHAIAPSHSQANIFLAEQIHASHYLIRHHQKSLDVVVSCEVTDHALHLII